ncbi:MAG: HAD-IIIC family phosphatase [Puniceicoccales bacterium]|jgi:FkbH-like protein|nr:HAD-IIIC family phosphatase [Puniceicoccales bacterium]
MNISLSEEALAALDTAGVRALLQAMPEERTAAALLPAVRRWAQVDLATVRAFMDCWPEPAAATAQVAEEVARQSAMGRWLAAELAQQAGDTTRALRAWEGIIEAGGSGQMAAALLARTRLLAQAGDADGALATLRRMLRDAGANGQATRAQADKLYVRIAPKVSTPVAGRAVRIAVLGSGTTAFLIPMLRMAAVRDGFAPVFYEGPYGAFRQEILDAESGLFAFKPDFVILATHWRDAHFPAFSNEPEKAVEEVAKEFQQLWAALLARHPCTLVQNNFDVPWDDPSGHLGQVEAGSRPACLRRLNLRLTELAPHSVLVADFDSAAASYGKARWASPRQWFMSKQHPALECLPEVADLWMALIRAAAGLSKKVLVLDLDNTLWAGTIGEDGLQGIRVGAPSAEGEAHAALQRYALELKERGVLLAVCSKNNMADARLPFEKHDGMLLSLDDFVAFSANWENKADNLKRMAQALNLGVDSFVFLDDNPVERALVRQALPGVAVPEVGRDPAEYVEILHRGRWFDSPRISAEDRKRHASYKANAARDTLQATVADMDSFLRHLEMRVTRGAFDATVLDRVAQLLGKTNQFNLTTRRHSLEQVRRLAETPSVWTQWFRLEDKFGDNGLIGVMIATPAEADTWEVDTFLMSCRVIGRRMEDYMAATLLDAARQRGIRRVIGRYLPTAKNGMVAKLYERLGFAADPSGQKEVFVFDLTAKAFSMPEYFQTKVS